MPSWIFHKLIARWWPHFILCSPCVCTCCSFCQEHPAPQISLWQTSTHPARFSSVITSSRESSLTAHSNPGLPAGSQGFFSWPLADSLAVSAPCCTLRSGTGSYSPLHPPCPDQYPTCVMNSKTVLVNESRISGINEAIQGCGQELRCWNQPAWVHLPFSTTYRLCDLGSFLGFSGSQSSQRLGELERSWPGSTQAFSSSSEYFFNPSWF